MVDSGMGEVASPARAGMDLSAIGRSPAMRCFPRTRGDGPYAGHTAEEQATLPPHARGWTLNGYGAALHSVASPARAGMDPSGNTAQAFSRSFPRTRGDGPAAVSAPISMSSLPPHARGWTPSLGHAASSIAASPARAGMDPIGYGTNIAQGSFPRTRGDGP